MAKGYKTDQELLRSQNESFFILDKLLKNSREDYKAVMDLIPGFFQVSNAHNFSIEHCNTYINELIDMSTQEIRDMGVKFITEYIDEYTVSVTAPRIQEYLKENGRYKSFSFFQRVKHPRKESQIDLFTVTKPSQDGRFLITYGNVLSEMEGVTPKLEKMLDEQEFMRKNLRKFHALTKREIEILTLLAYGNNNPTIADKLLISRRTVEQHRRHINKKLDIKTFADIMKFAQAFDLI